jgi:glyoxalase family protein
MSLVRGLHHLTMCVGPAQEDYDFHTRALGLYNVKKTALYDGKAPIYHLYYANRRGDGSTILTTFPFRQAGIMGTRGANQIKILNLDVPADSIGYWADRLSSHGIAYEEADVFGTQRLHFAHPCGIGYALVGEKEPDDREPYDGAGVPAEHAIRGGHGVTISTHSPDEMAEYIVTGLGGELTGEKGPSREFQVGTSEGYGRYIEVVHEPDLAVGTWKFGEGTVHHVAWDVVTSAQQQELKDWLEGLGYTDCSEPKDRGYFHSVYNRSPSGALFEYAWSIPEGFLVDEDFETLGQEFQVSPQFADRKDEILAMLESIDTGVATR